VYSKQVLNNGVRLVSEDIPHVRSVSLGIWIGSGSRYEEPREHGVSHFLEHLFFKGTANRTAKEIAESLESVGGQLNAFTTKEYTCLYAKVLDEHLDLAIDVLSDMFFNSLFTGEDIAKEKRVVLEEISMYEDAPDELVHDLFNQAAWPAHPLGRPILGTAESVSALAREQVVDYYRRHYIPSRIVIAAAGNLDHEVLKDKLGPIFSASEGRPLKNAITTPKAVASVRFHEKDTEQVQICLGVPGLAQEDDDIYVLHVLNNVLGGGVSSRLFQEIREERGLAYSVYAYHTSHIDTGLFVVYAGTSPASAPEVTELLVGEMAKIRDNGITAAELARTREQIKGNLFLGLESVSSRMNRLGKSEICFNRMITPEEVIDRIAAVTLDDVYRVANKLFRRKNFSLTTVGPEPIALDFPDLIGSLF
jgi:predicted Zn-dependent peptidase